VPIHNPWIVLPKHTKRQHQVRRRYTRDVRGGGYRAGHAVYGAPPQLRWSRSTPVASRTIMANGETNSILPPDGHAGTTPRCMCTAMSCNRLFIHKGERCATEMTISQPTLLLTMPTAEELLVRLEMGTSMLAGSRAQRPSHSGFSYVFFTRFVTSIPPAGRSAVGLLRHVEQLGHRL